MDKKEMMKMLSGDKDNKFVTKSGDLKKVDNKKKKHPK